MNKRFQLFIGRTIFSLVKNFRISIFISYTGFLTSEENRMVILLTTWPLCWEGAKEFIFGRNNRYESVLRLQYFVSTFLFHFCQNNLYTYSINKLLHAWLARLCDFYLHLLFHNSCIKIVRTRQPCMIFIC